MQIALTLVHVALAAASGEVESPEEESGGGTGVAVISIAAIALGWIVLFALWWFIFRDRKRRPNSGDGADPEPGREDPPL